MSDEDEKLDLGAWRHEEPPSDFAERVLAKVREEAPGANTPAGASAPVESMRIVSKPRPNLRGGIAVGVVAALALAAAVAVKVGAGVPAQGEATASDRREVAIGDRAIAVLEPGAQVKWNGDDVEQPKGDVFYRVQPGARFKVHTGAGDVEVKGTCFTVKVRRASDELNRGDSKEAESDMQKRDLKSAAVGAAATALAFVAVYEGKVAVSHANQRADLIAGESAQLGSGGVTRSANMGEGQKAFEAKAAEALEGDALTKANQNLVAQVAEYRARLETIAAQRSTLEDKLKHAEEKLASASDGGNARGGRSEWDLDKDDWAELAKEGKIKYRVPCQNQEGWTLSPEKLQKLALAPTDAAPLREAYAANHKRLWTEIKPMCVAALNSSNEIVEKIGLSTCPHLIHDIAMSTDSAAAREAMTQAAEIRAGLRAEPPVDKQHPVMRMFLVLTNANKGFEADLAKTFGPEEAHRLAYADGMCTGTSTWGGGNKRTPEKK